MEVSNKTNEITENDLNQNITHIKAVVYTSLVLVLIIICGIILWFIRFMYKKRQERDRQMSESESHFRFGLRPISFKSMNLGLQGSNKWIK